MNRSIMKIVLAFIRSLLAICVAVAVSSPAHAERPRPSAAKARPQGEGEIVMTVRASPQAELVSSLEISNSALLDQLSQAQEEAASAAPLISDIEVEIRGRGAPRAYRLDRTGALRDAASARVYRPAPDAARRLLAYAEALRGRHYGRLIPWSAARTIVKRKSVFTIVDLESGLSFRVQRRAGSRHADVQPLTRQDSKIMKEIYGGKWSWDRRAILVRTEQTTIAASMNGMPHGGDGIPGNGFKGHFCVHFLDSTSHRSDSPDPEHQLMVYKATGNLRGYFDAASPLVQARGFVGALNGKDEQMLRQLWLDAPPERMAAYAEWMASLRSIAVKSARTDGRIRRAREQEPPDSLAAEIRLPISLRMKGERTRNVELTFVFKRDSPHEPWRLVDVAADPSNLMP
ncbi:hypothetical protein ACF3MZ_09805 [Paenibacillaceae bacterium WGS1546]|uniref:hypothetical protein n=1 Tax=Cohnella sp. WGS1546 TaxID=3366810 RepID=UPI00372CEE39